MPMYEKGSVRAEPRSKQQERMKKIMKKFLSSLLALTMILSLVIVPAQANNDHEWTWATSGGPTMKVQQGDGTLSDVTGNTVQKGTKLTFTVENVGVNKDGSAATAGTDYTISYSWTGSSTGVTGSDNVATITTSTAGTVTARCTVTIFSKGEPSTKLLEQSRDISVTVKDFETAAKSATVSFKGRTYTLSNGSVSIDLFGDETLGSSLDVTVAGYPDATLTLTGSQWKIKDSASGSLSQNVTITGTPANGQTLNVAAKDNKTTIYEGQKVKLTATYNRSGSQAVSYEWAVIDSGIGNVAYDKTTNKATFTAPSTVSSDAPSKIQCTVKEGTSVSKRETITITVKDDPYSPYRNGESSSKTIATNNSATCEIQAPVLKSSNDIIPYRSNNTDNFDIAWVVTRGSSLVSVEKRPADGYGIVTAKSGAKSGTATVTATITYMGKEYPALEYTIDISALDAELSSIVNGDSDSYSLTNIKDKLADAIKKQNSSFSYNDINTITVVGTPSRVTLKNGRTTLTNGSSVNDDITIYADKAYIGDASFQLKVNNNYVVTMYLTVDSKGEIKDTVTGTSANKSVTFTNSDYDCLYIYEGSASFKSDMYNGDWSRTSYVSRNWKPVAENKDYTVSSSAFDRNGKATLYVVAVDDDIASTGTITVSQKSYDINYNVVAGKSVTFNQKDFEDFLEDYAEDNGNYNPKKDEITFDHATLNSLPTAKSEGTLYYSGSEVTSSTNKRAEYTDMDKMTFEAVAKPSKDTVTLTFRVYGEIEKPNSRKPDKVDYYVNVVISVVKEDITYTVGIDDTVQLTARDFVNFLQDARTSYRKAELDYVKFDVSGKNVSSYAYGGLYRSYSSYSTGKLADSTDKFYYEPSRTQYDLADVAYHTTRWAEAGKTVYIPFTVYGTKGEEASGTMAITIAQTMNFIDVKASDFFYEPVKWAVNNKITNGTSSTTFSPYKNCNRAEIVTFLWRAAGSPEPTSTRNPFTDVNSVRDASYYKAILWASQKGITAGTNATTFSPYQECTRSQIVTFLYRYAGKPSGNYSNPFKDVSSVNEASYYNAILWAVGKGITQGTSTTTFSPYASCTRGEAVTFLYRYVNGVK